MNLYGPKQLADSMRTVRKNTILIAEDIPEKDYGYRPTPESRSVGETLVHIASLSRVDHFLHEEEHVSSLEGFDFGALIKKSEIEEKRRRSNAGYTLIGSLEETSVEEAKEVFKFFMLNFFTVSHAAPDENRQPRHCRL